MYRPSSANYFFAFLLAVLFGVVVSFLVTEGTGRFIAYLVKENLPKSQMKSLALAAPTAVKLQSVNVSQAPLPQASPLSAVSYIDEQDFAVPALGKMIKADLRGKKIYLYENGELQKTLDIVSIGKSGSPWATPSGKYEVMLKERNHFSSIGSVWMPYSIQFWGNYFIHGWPYYPDGTEVDPGFSGGCIRLATSDAAEVYSFAEKSTPIYVYGAEGEMGAKKNFLSDRSSSEIPVTAESFLVADLETGEIIYEKEKDKKVPIASISKLMTALVSLDVINPFNEAVITEKVLATYGESGALVAGEVLAIKDLAYPLLLESSNDAAEVIADYYGRERFIKAMNERAKVLDLENTSFEDPSGISPNNQSTATDLFKFLRHLYRYKPYILEVTKEPIKLFEKHQWRNNNPFVYEEGFLGGKSGQTEAAKQAFANLFKAKLAEGKERSVAIVILRSDDREKDTRIILEYLKNFVSYNH